MTIDDVVQHVRETTGWRLAFHRKIRRDVGRETCCPITSMSEMSPAYWSQCATRLNLSDVDARAIVYAADRVDGDSEYSPALRARLLEAAGLV